jgi:hypothetical protein
MAQAKNHHAMTKSPFTNKPQSMLVTGGKNFGGALSTVEILTDNGWEVFTPSLPFTVWLHCMVLLNSSTIIVVGGNQNGATSAKTYLISDDKKVKKSVWIMIHYKY